MRKILAVLLPMIALGVSACGGHKLSASQSKQEQAAVTTAQTAVQKCLPTKDGAPDVLVLRSKAARQRFLNCAVPPKKRVAFDTCVTRVVLGGLPTKARLERGINGCLSKAGV